MFKLLCTKEIVKPFIWNIIVGVATYFKGVVIFASLFYKNSTARISFGTRIFNLRAWSIFRLVYRGINDSSG